MGRKWIALCVVLLVAGCGAADPVWAPDEAVEKVRYRHPGPPKLTLFTMNSVDTDAGAHTSLMINASERVIFDPSGSFAHPAIPERNDVIFGARPTVADVYTRYHARETYYVHIQEVEVSPEVAELAYELVKKNGAVPNGQCARATSAVLSKLPGFENIRTTWFPKVLAAEMAKVPGVTEKRLYEYDSDDNSKVLRDYVPTAD